MKTNTRTSTCLLLTASAAALCALTVTSAHADPFGSGGNAFTIDFATIGDPGNANDAAFDDTAPGFSSPYGAVGYTFQMGKYEISEDMINKANTLGNLLITKDTREVDKPATHVSWNEAARFVNWLNTSTGHHVAYDLTQIPPGLNGNIWSMALWSSEQAWQLDGQNPYRHKDAYYFLPSENEWYKAAYYSGSGAIYYDYATGSDTIPTAVASGTASGSAISGQSFDQGPADIAQAGGLSHYGTMGQNGNAFEMMESAFNAPNDSSSEVRAVRGGYWYTTELQMRSSRRGLDFGPTHSDVHMGFRVASVPASAPEPSSVVLLLGGGALLGLRRRR